MSDTTPRLELPLLAPSQAQKHVTHNEAIARLDALVQLVLEDMDATTAPDTPLDGAIFGLGVAPVGAWADKAGMLAVWQQSGWVFVEPQEGWRAWNKTAAGLFVYDGAAWTMISSDTNELDGVGVQTSWDAVNRLAVASDAALFTHAGAGHQVKVNKASISDTASLLFQSDWAGHAEMGLAGDNAFSLKVSADGSTWDQVLRVDAVTQTLISDYVVSGLAVQQSAQDATPGRLMRTDWGYSQGNAVGTVSQVSGQPSGALIESGSNANGEYCRWADGTQICWQLATLTYDIGSRLRYDWTFPMVFASTGFPAVTANLRNEFGATPGPENFHGPFARQGSNPSSTGCSLRVYRTEGTVDFNTGDTLPVQAIAIGRWF